MKKTPKVCPVTFRTTKANLDYLQDIALHNDRSISTLVHWGISYVVRQHKEATSGNRAGLEVLQLLGPTKTPTHGSTDSQLFCRTSSTTKGQIK
jgi:hypothetical protein